MKNNLKHVRTCVYNCNYHIVFSTKYRRKVLNQEIEYYIKDLIRQIAKEKEFEVAVIICSISEDTIKKYIESQGKKRTKYL